MKKINYIMLTILLVLGGCSAETKTEIKRPSEIPENCPRTWGTYEDQAYKDGRMSFNEDSTACYIQAVRPRTVENAKKYVEYSNQFYSDSTKITP